MYSKIQASFWTDEKVGSLSSEEKLAFLYVVTNPHRNIIGLYRLPLMYVACDLGWTVEKVLKAFGSLSERSFIAYERGVEHVLIRHFLRHNPIENPNQLKGALAKLEEMAKSPLITAFARALETLDQPYLEPLRNRLETLRKEVEVEVEVEVKEKVKVEVEEEGGSPACADSSTSSTLSSVVPCSSIVDLYHEITTLPRVKVLTNDRSKLIRARWNQSKDFQSLDFWRGFFGDVASSDFLNGRVEPAKGKKPFLADLEWLVRPGNFAKVLEGKYSPRGNGANGSGLKAKINATASRSPDEILGSAFSAPDPEPCKVSSLRDEEGFIGEEVIEA